MNLCDVKSQRDSSDQTRVRRREDRLETRRRRSAWADICLQSPIHFPSDNITLLIFDTEVEAYFN